MRRFFVLAIALPTAFASFGFAQVSLSSTNNNGVFSGSATFETPRFRINPIVGAPYSGDRVSEHVQTLADGTHITQPQQLQAHEYRDSQGRTRTERPFGPPMQRMGVDAVSTQEERPMIVEITDTVAGFQYVLDQDRKVAHRTALPTQNPRSKALPAAARQPVADNARPQFSTESLGSQSIEGTLADGTRRTTTWPIGSQNNDRPIVSTDESWLAKDLKTIVLSKNNDPRRGESTNRMINISRAEPDPALFMPPADYTIVDETERFTIKFGQEK